MVTKPKKSAGIEVPGENYLLKDGSVKVPEATKATLKKIADSYFDKTGKKLVLTDGERTAQEQASAMYNKLEKDGEDDVRKLYRSGKNVNEIIDAYNSAPDGTEKQKMSETIQKQIDDGRYISDHLRNNAVDVSVRDMSQSDRTAFETIVSDSDGVDLLDETNKKSGAHYHLSF